MKFICAFALSVSTFVGLVPTSTAQLTDEVKGQLDQARSLIMRRQYDDGIGEIKRALKMANGQCVPCYLELVRAYQMVGGHKNAMEAAEKLLEIAPDDKTRSTAHNAIGVSIVFLADNKKANYADGLLSLALGERSRYSFKVAMPAMIDNPRRARESFAPDFSFVTKEGEYVTLDDVKGKVVLLDFWASWCKPCESSLPTLQHLSKKYGKEQFMIVSISGDTNEQAWQTFIEQHRMDWPQVLDKDHKIHRLFNISPIPTYILIDSEGIMRSLVIGANFNSDLENEVKKNLKRAENLPKPGRS